jgi:two-component system chemotaxis response regulator CheB
VAVAASAGGIPALGELLGALPASFPGAVLVVLHLERHRASRLAQVLQRSTTLVVSEAAGGERPAAGHVYVAPPNRHLRVAPDGRLELTEAPPEHFSRPSADPLFASLAAFRGARAVAVVLSGMGVDGAAGAAEVARGGGTVLVQDAASAEHYGMPGAALASCAGARVLSPGALAPLLETLASAVNETP